MPYRRTKKYEAQRRRGPRGGRTPRDQADDALPLPDLRMRITVERFDFGDEAHVFELCRTRRIDSYAVSIDGKPWKRCGLSGVLEGVRKACPRVLSPRAACR